MKKVAVVPEVKFTIKSLIDILQNPYYNTSYA